MLIAPFASNRIKHAAYELALGEEAYVTSSPGKTTVRRGDHITIPPGQFALLHSAEIVKVPADALAFISIKARIKLKGLVNISGFHVDPGFQGQLIFSVHNAGSRPVTITCGEPCFLIWFGTLTQPTADVYTGSHGGQSGISSDAVDRINGEIASPAELSVKFRNLKRAVSTQWVLIGILFTLILASIFQPAITRWFERNGGSASATGATK
jgi:dCTP deaminase